MPAGVPSPVVELQPPGLTTYVDQSRAERAGRRVFVRSLEDELRCDLRRFCSHGDR